MLAVEKRDRFYKITEIRRLEALAGRTVEEAYEMIDKLTPKERDVLSLLAKGTSKKKIAELMEISMGSVHNYCSKLRWKLRAANDYGCLAVWFLRHLCD